MPSPSSPSPSVGSVVDSARDRSTNRRRPPGKEFPCAISCSSAPIPPASPSILPWTTSRNGSPPTTRVVGESSATVWPVLPPRRRSGCAAIASSSRTAPSRKRRNGLPDSTCSSAPDWMRPSRSRRSIPWPASVGSRSGHCGRAIERSGRSAAATLARAHVVHPPSARTPPCPRAPVGALPPKIGLTRKSLCYNPGRQRPSAITPVAEIFGGNNPEELQMMWLGTRPWNEDEDVVLLAQHDEDEDLDGLDDLDEDDDEEEDDDEDDDLDDDELDDEDDDDLDDDEEEDDEDLDDDEDDEDLDDDEDDE